MSLNWDVSAIVAREGEDYVWPRAAHAEPNYGIAQGDRRLSGLTDCLIWATMIVGLNEITEKNWRDFAKRVRAFETVNRPISSNGKPIEPETVRRHIGLRTNASRLTAAAFERKLGAIAQQYAARAVADAMSGAEPRP